MNYNEQEVKYVVDVLTKCQASASFFTHPSQKGKFIWLNNPPEGRLAEIRKQPNTLDGKVYTFFKGTDNAYMIQAVDGIVFLVCIDKFGNTIPDMRFAFLEPAVAGNIELLPI